jgi:protein tyrosine phosphatase (PTP) superfamily phosphohydrolase (DUF442 family)
MKTGRQKVLFTLNTLLLGAVLFLPAGVSAGQYENLRAQDPLAKLNLTAALNNNFSNAPAVSAPAPVFDAAAEKSAANPLPNFAQVSPGLYRSGQPAQAGMARIQSSGIKTIIKLNDNAPAEADWAASAGLGFETLLMSNKQSPTYDQIDAALAIINDPARQPVLVHCHLGHDRTGAVIGAYRVTVQGWSVDKAAAEAKTMGYSAPGFQDITTYLQGYLAHTRQREVPPGEVRDAGSAQPNWSVTPGNLCTPSDPNFKEYRYSEHIAYCQRNVTQQMKQQVAATYNVPQNTWSNYEFDHLIPLCIGGDSSVDNLWPQPHGATESGGKDKLENQLYNEMAAGAITQKAAVQQIYAWFKGYAARHPELPRTMQARFAALGN